MIMFIELIVYNKNYVIPREFTPTQSLRGFVKESILAEKNCNNREYCL